MSSSRTETLEAARRVFALSPAAKEGVQQALVNILAVLACLVHLVPGVRPAPVRPGQVLAGAVAADVLALGGAFVDVNPAMCEAGAMRTELVVL